MEFTKYDVIIVGAGLSGLYAALNLDKNLKVLLLSKNELTLCNSALAQGGVAAVLDTENDSVNNHINDTLVAGSFKNDRDNLEILVSQGPTDIKNLVDYGVEFDKSSDGSLHLTLEGGHTKNRIAHHKDSTGFEIVTKLINCAKQLDNTDILEHSHLCAVEKMRDYFNICVRRNNRYLYYTSPYIVLATGGIGRIYEHTTNSAIATGDGIYFAHKLGAKIKDLSLIQFHPTAFADKSKRECFLISEAVRGEGAFLLNCDKERFMHNYDDRLELAPRDVVSRSILAESKKTASNDFYIDISHKPAEFLKGRFPMIYNKLLEVGYDLTKDSIPIYPCQHYLMGGIDVNGNGASSIKNLYAIGECSHTGVHGENRLASNSLLEALVFSRLTAIDINKDIASNPDIINYVHETQMRSPEGDPLPTGIRTKIREVMQKSYFVVPDYDNAKEGLKIVGELSDMLENGNYAVTPEYTEASGAAALAKIILTEVISKKD